MTEQDAAALAEAGALFDEPTSTVQLASGIGRHWPDARGIFFLKGQHEEKEEVSLAAFVNDEDHLRLSFRLHTPHMAAAYGDRVLNSVQELLEKWGHSFMRTEKLGYLTTCPSNLGAAMQISVKMRLPKLGTRPDFKRICKAQNFDARRGEDEEWELSRRSILGMSEDQLMSSVTEGCRHLIGMEQALESGTDPVAMS